MTDFIVLRPALSTRVPTDESRTEAFARQNFGGRVRSAAIELRVPASPNPNQLILAEVLLDLCLRMDPVVSEVRVSSGCPDVARIIGGAARRLPLERLAQPDAEIDVVRFAVGPSELPYVDASDWVVGFNAPVGGGRGDHPAGAFIGALEAAKYVFLRAVAIAYERKVEPPSWQDARIFDTWSWAWSTLDGEPSQSIRLPPVAPTIALVGCGGVGAGYLWFLRKTRFSGALLLVDHDIIKWHNMNRLLYATTQDANDRRPKVLSAADYMAEGWTVRPFVQKAEHTEVAAALSECARAGGLLASAVGEPETRKYLGRRGFEHFFDAGTNSDGWARVLALRPGLSRCSECEIQSRAAQRPEDCGLASTEVFAGVVPHLAMYAGVLLALEHARVLLGAPVLGGSNTQSIMMDLDPSTRGATRPCSECPMVTKGP